MKRILITAITGILFSGIISPVLCYSQGEKAVINKYLKRLPDTAPPAYGQTEKYRMTAVYTNMDLFGNFMDKTKVTGDYTSGLKDGYVKWENIFIAASKKRDEPFPEGVKQEYMEGFKYIPSEKMVQSDAFKNFPKTTENIFARNLIWDMYSFDIFVWRYYDSLRLNQTFTIPDINGEFDMAEIGKYSHNKICLIWKGITELNGSLCAVIDFNALDNKLAIDMDMISTKGTEQYWGTVLVSLKTKSIEKGIMYSGTIQEVNVKGMDNKFYIKTIRELTVDRIL
jgi:hypothetical protein